jgi:very-short-patch-repair endonuclease
LPPGAAVTGRVAAQVWGVALDALDERVEIISSRRIRLTSDVLVHTGYIAHDEVTVHRGVTLTRPLHTAWELARAWPDVDAIGWIDALARRQRLTRSELRAHARRHASESRSRAATRTLHLADPRSESPPESRLRLEMLRAGLPLPIPQFRLVVDGFFVARLDFAWPALKFAVEYDGQWHVDARQLHRDRSRLRDIVAAGWCVFPVTREDMRDMPQLIGQFTAALKQRARELGRTFATL